MGLMGGCRGDTGSWLASPTLDQVGGPNWGWGCQEGGSLEVGGANQVQIRPVGHYSVHHRDKSFQSFRHSVTGLLYIEMLVDPCPRTTHALFFKFTLSTLKSFSPLNLLG